MAEEPKVTKETPTIVEEKPTGTPQVKPEVKPVDETAALLIELEKAGVSTVGELDGKLIASREAGNLANQLGTARSEIAELKTMIGNQQIQTPASEGTLGQEETDLDNIIGRKMEDVLDKREKKQSDAYKQSQQMSLNMWNAIQNDPDYGLVKEVWEEKMKDPNFGFKVQQGLLNPYKEYNDTVREYLKGNMQRAADTIKQLQGKGKVLPPHVETGERVSTNLITETPGSPEYKAKLQALRDKGRPKFTQDGKVIAGERMKYEDELSVIDTLFESPVAPEQK